MDDKEIKQLYNWIPKLVSVKIPNDKVEDVVAACVVAIWESEQTLRSQGARTAWMRTIVRNKIADFYRQQAIRQRDLEIRAVTCPECGKQFIPKKERGRKQIYCGDRCRSRASTRAYRKRQKEFECAECGRIFIPRTRKGRRKKQIYCEDRCRWRANIRAYRKREKLKEEAAARR